MENINLDNFKILNNDFFHNKHSSMFVIEAPRFSGKTTFIKDYLIKKEHIYFSFYPNKLDLLTKEFILILEKKLKIKILSDYIRDFNDVFKLINKIKIKTKIVLALEDIDQFLLIDKDGLGIIKSFFNNSTNLIQLILTSSKKLNLKNSIILKEFSFFNILPKRGLTLADKFHFYAVFNGSDKFITYYNTKLPFLKNIHNICLDVNSPFFRYGFEYLRNFSDIGTYCAILYAISINNNTTSQIANTINMKPTALSRYLIKLQNNLIIEKKLPLNIKPNNKLSKYFIKDHFLKFWFCYVYNNIPQLNQKRYSIVLDKINNSFLKYILNPAYKKFILDLIKQNPVQYLGYKPIEIDSWWNKDNFIDLVAYDKSNISFIKISFEDANIVRKYLHILKAMSFETNLKKKFIIISKDTLLTNLV